MDLKRHKLFSINVFVFMIFAIGLISIHDITNKPKDYSSIYCEDTDSGDVPEVTGMITLSNSDLSLSKRSDYCYEGKPVEKCSDCELHEYYCDGERHKKNIIKVGDGYSCSGGKIEKLSDTYITSSTNHVGDSVDVFIHIYANPAEEFLEITQDLPIGSSIISANVDYFEKDGKYVFYFEDIPAYFFYSFNKMPGELKGSFRSTTSSGLIE